MLNGEHIRLRMLREDDLEAFYAHQVNLEARGQSYPLDVRSLTEIRRDFESHGLWEDESGTLLIVDHDDAMLGVLLFFRRVTYPHWDAYEIAYRLFDPANHGRGVMTEALGLLVDYLFASHRVNRIELVIMPDNPGSIRVAEKCGFRHEGTARGAFLHRGEARDVEVFARLRDDPVR
jgi:ribosomal-protein-alanine N-acetyltransferase